MRGFPMSELFRKIMRDDIDIPGMPDLAVRVIAALEDEYCSISKLEQVIMTDLSITATILKIANAPLYQTGKAVTRVADAMVMIGMQNVIPFVCISALANQYSGASYDGIVTRHLLAVSQTASFLAGSVKTVPIKREMAAIAGLFHDSGKLVLYANIPKEYSKIKSRAHKEKIAIIELEDELLGFNHCLIGGALAAKWKLPAIYRETIRKHHDEKVRKSGIKEEDALCYLIRVSDKMMLDIDNSHFISGERHLPELLVALGIEEAEYKKLAKKIREKGIADI